MLPSMIGGYQLGSDTEVISFEPDGVAYRCAGVTHAVDPEDPANAHAASMGDALCGTPVRIWPDQPFDPRSREAHDGVSQITDAAIAGEAEPAGR